MKILFLTLVSALSLNISSSKAQQNPINSFETLNVSGGGNVYVFYSPEATFEIKKNGNSSKGITIVENPGTLSVTITGDGKRAEIFIGTPYIRRINQSGGGNIQVRKGFGILNNLACTIRGGGNIKVWDGIYSLYASVSGGGNLSAYVIKSLEGKINGGGNIFYRGTAVVKSDISGGGEIKKL